MQKLIELTQSYFTPVVTSSSSPVDITDVPFRECGKPVFDSAPVVIYNPANAGSILTAAILNSEKGWKCFKAGDLLPVANQYIWLDTQPNRKLFADPVISKKSSHYLFIQGFHPMEAKVAMWGAFQNRYADWVFASEKPRPHEFLLGVTLGTESYDRYSTIVELTSNFYRKGGSNGVSKEAIFKEICPLACVYANVKRALHTLQFETPFFPVGIEQEDIYSYLTAIQEIKNLLKDMRVDTVTEHGEVTGECCTTTISQDFWLARRVVMFSYRYYLNISITLNGVVVDSNVKKPPERYIDAIVVR